MDISGKIAQANGRLKIAQIGVAIGARGNRLYLRATLPPKPSSSKQLPSQQRLFLGYHANPAGLKLAEQEARKVGGLLQCGEFDWTPYLKELTSKPDQVASWVERFEQDYFTRRKRTPQSETTWEGDYLKVFSQLPPDEPLTVQLLTSTITSTSPDTRTRKRFVDVCGRLAAFAGLEANFKPLKGHYSPAKVVPRNLPSDEAIAQWWEKIPNPTWQRAYGLLATYGLRPHEIFYLNFDRLPVLQVEDSEMGEEAKTGQRRIYPFYPEWCDGWSLAGELPTVTGRNNSALGNRVTHAFARYGVPFAPYDLRHAWAVRSMQFGLDVSLAAAQMGHSVRVHCEIYHAWITDAVHQKAYEALMSRGDRPVPPAV